jgi:two-component system, OmpR family, phosphate regulon response regulator PhoB
MPSTTRRAGARPHILVLGAGSTAPAVRDALDRVVGDGEVEVRQPRKGADVRDADLVVLVVGDDEPDAADAVAGVRSETDRPIVVVAGPRPDRFTVFDAGADDVAGAPIDPDELTARVAVRLARSSRGRDAMRHGPLVVDPARRVVTLDDEPVPLTAREFDLLEFLARHPGQAFDRSELLDAVWRSSIEWQQARTVTEHVHRLRRKLGAGWVTTVHGVGYRFEPRDRRKPTGG